ncbi:hypothetical protein niasHS_008604 [Heterodera schachtii]
MMRHKLQNGLDVIAILFFLREFTTRQDCTLTIFRNEHTEICSWTYPSGGSSTLLITIQLMLLEKLGPYAFVTFDLHQG